MFRTWYDGVAFNEHSSDPKVRDAAPTLEQITTWLNQRAARIAALDGSVSVRDGLEVNLTPNGSIDVPSDLARRMGYVIASQHGGLGDSQNDKDAIRTRLANASDNEDVDTIGHPFRFNDETPGVNWGRILSEMLLTGTMAEVNLNCFWKSEGSNRFWFNWLKTCADIGVPLVIGYDIHNSGMWPQRMHDVDWHTPQQLLDMLLQMMTAVGIKQSQILNSTLTGWNHWLDTPKPERVSLISW
jgi:histidinol phosphatase-like PHP family hydrolase